MHAPAGRRAPAIGCRREERSPGRRTRAARPAGRQPCPAPREPRRPPPAAPARACRVVARAAHDLQPDRVCLRLRLAAPSEGAAGAERGAAQAREPVGASRRRLRCAALADTMCASACSTGTPPSHPPTHPPTHRGLGRKEVAVSGATHQSQSTATAFPGRAGVTPHRELGRKKMAVSGPEGSASPKNLPGARGGGAGLIERGEARGVRGASAAPPARPHKPPRLWPAQPASQAAPQPRRPTSR